MMQETTAEFARRLIQAVEGHPQAPPTPFGRQSWLLETLANETGEEVSANTMSKWFNGQARPRPDKIRKLAQVLRVDEVWLAMGRKRGTQDPGSTLEAAQSGRGAVLLVAGLVEIAGGRVIFAGDDKAPVDLHVSLRGAQFDAIMLSGAEQKKKLSVVVPEPVGNARVFAVVQASDENCPGSACIDLVEITEVQRQRVGGFSIVEVTRKDAHHFRAKNHAGKWIDIPPLETIAALADV